MGWSLEGLPVIQRCRANKPQDGYMGGVNFDAKDRFCLESARLIALVDGTDGGNNAEYRTELDTFVRVFSYGTAGSGPQYWVVKNKAGETLEFGGNATNPEGRIEAQGKTSVRVWALNKITDASGNYLTVTYTEDSVNGDYRPLRIDYTGNEGQGLATQRKVEFTYGTRTDAPPLYVDGSLVKTTKRPTNIKTSAPPPGGGAAVLVRDYRLAYEYGAATKRSRLKTITECDANNSCLPPTTFTWQEGGDGTFEIPAVTWTAFPSGWDKNNVKAGDVDGDGQLDLVSQANGQFYVALSNGDGTFQIPAVTWTGFPSGWDKFNVQAGDINGDGKLDLVSMDGAFRVAFSNGDGTFQIPAVTWTSFPTGWNKNIVQAGDLNGDGKLDLVSIDGGFRVAFSKGDGTFGIPAVTWTAFPSGWDKLNVQAGDLNGDGKLDLVSQANGKFYVVFSNGDGTFEIPAVTWTSFPSGWNKAIVQAGDLNGDGKLDLVSIDGGFRVAFSSGPFPDLLTSITTNLGGKIDISYKPITDNTVYTKDTDAVYPVMDIQSAMYVVDNYVAGTNDGTGTSYTFTYDYIGAKLHLLGRGWLGFHQTTGVDQTAGVKNVHIFRQVDPTTNLVDFPFVGMQDLAQTKDMQDGLFAHVKNFYTSFGTQVNQPKVVFPTVTRQVKDQCEGQPLCFTTAQTFEFDTDAPGGKTFGNPVHTLHEGDVSVTGDERHERTEWLVYASGTDWLHRPKTNRLLDSNNAVVREKFLYYDDQPYGSLGSRGLVTKEESSLTGGPGDPGNPSVTHTYDPFGNRETTTDPIGCATKTVFDSLKTFPASVTRCFGDINPSLVHSTTFDHDPRFGTRTRVTDANNNTTTFTFDSFGRLATVVGPLDSVAFPTETRAYLNWGDPANQRIQTLKRKDHLAALVISREEYFDGLGRFDLIKSTGPNDPATGQPRTIMDQSFYDSRGLITIKIPSRFDTEAPLAAWGYTYDVMGRQIRVDHPDDRFSETIYEPGKVTLVNERGKSKVKHLDGYGQVEQIDEINGSETYTTIYEYDAAGLLFHVKNHLDHHTRIKYDAIGRKVAMCDPNMGAGPDTTTCDESTPGAWVYTYDNAGNLKTQADAKLKPLGQALVFDYDSHSRMIKKTYPDTRHIDFTYDQGANSVGRLSRVDDLNSMVTTFLYDVMGRVTQTQRTIDGYDYTMSQTYNALSKVTSEMFPDLDGATYTYNEAGWLKTVDGYVNLIDYNARGQKKKIDYFNNVSTTFDYFDQNTGTQFINFALLNRTTTGPGGALQDLDYDYDEVGNVELIVDGILGGTAGRTFGYDDLNRMTSASGTFGANQQQASCDYTYNAIGNILNKCGVGYSYNDAMHPSFVTSRSDGKTYTADINGNTQNGDGRIFAWTADNRVESVTMGGTTTMDYDYTGQRVKKYGPLGQVLYPFAGYEIGSDGTKTKFFRAGNELLAAKQSPVVNPEKKLFYHNDHLGGVNVITDINAARVQLNEYDPWGKVSRSEGNVRLNWT